MKRIIWILPLALLLLGQCQNPPVNYLEETADERDERMEWWREARFGMFIHWGLYAVPAGEWNGTTNHAEWIRTTAQIPLEEYDQFLEQFNPVKYDAEDWVRMAKEAGMKYIVITSKHHDGFGLFNSKHTDFDVMSTPYQRDILKELANACHREGIRICWYHSIMDWHHPDYLPRRGWEKDRTTEGADFDRYVSYMKNQLKELLTGYGDIGVLWFDGEWESTWTSDYGRDLYQYVRELQPDIIINNRVTVGRGGMAGITEEGEFGGDFGTPEQEIPATGIPGYDWETCMTMNNHWGYNKNDKNFKSTRELIRMLTDIASKGGNFLLNIGPTAEGVFPVESVDRLQEIGTWMKVNGESIYGTQASPFKNLDWGRCTQKSMVESTRLYLHVFDWPTDGQLSLPGLGSQPIRAFLLSDPDQNELPVQNSTDAVAITLPEEQPDPWNSVVVLDIEGEPVVYEAPNITAFSTLFIDSTVVSINKNEDRSEIRYTLDGSDPTASSALYEGQVMLKNTTVLKAACFIDGVKISGTRQQRFQQVSPLPSQPRTEEKAGLLYYRYEGDWDSLPDLTGRAPKMTGISENFAEANKGTDEYFALDYQGYIDIPETQIYKFYLTSDDGSKLYLDREVIIDHDGLHGADTKTGVIALEKGMHVIRISYFEKSGGNVLQLEWSSPSMDRAPVQSDHLYHLR